MNMRIFCKHIIGLSVSGLALAACAFERDAKYESDTTYPGDVSRPDVSPPDATPHPDLPPDASYDTDGHECSPIPAEAVESCDACGEGTRCHTTYTYDCGKPYVFCGSVAGSGCWSNEECGENYICHGLTTMMMPPPAEDAGRPIPAPQGYCLAQEGAACTTHYDCSAGGNSLVCLYGTCSPVETLSPCESSTGACTSENGADGYCESICVWPVVQAAPYNPDGAQYDPAPPCPSYCIPSQDEEGPSEPEPSTQCQSNEDCLEGQACVSEVVSTCTPDDVCNDVEIRSCQAVDAGG